MTALAAAGVKGTISGTVVDEHGIPVKHLVLDYQDIDMQLAGPMSQTQADENGHFAITISVSRDEDGTVSGGRWSVSPHIDPHDRNNYYLNPFNRFYHIGNAPEAISVTPDAPDAVVQIKLDPKGGALVGKITDAVTGHPISDYYMELAWTSDPSRGKGGGMGSSYRWLVPANTGITLKIRAKGYKPQQYQDLTVGSGQERVLDIQLQPDAK
jgi:hypothetical protein